MNREVKIKISGYAEIPLDGDEVMITTSTTPNYDYNTNHTDMISTFWNDTPHGDTEWAKAKVYQLEDGTKYAKIMVTLQTKSGNKLVESTINFGPKMREILENFKVKVKPAGRGGMAQQAQEVKFFVIE